MGQAPRGSRKRDGSGSEFRNPAIASGLGFYGRGEWLPPLCSHAQRFLPSHGAFPCLISLQLAHSPQACSVSSPSYIFILTAPFIFINYPIYPLITYLLHQDIGYHLFLSLVTMTAGTTRCSTDISESLSCAFTGSRN